MSRRSTFCALLLLALVTRVHAQQAVHTWVASNGNDDNLCTRTAPCRTFVAALARTAMGGEIDAVDAGDFGPIFDDANGRPAISRSITIDGGPAQAAIAFGSLAGVKVDLADPADVEKHVILRNRRINGFGTGSTGVSILNANEVELENVFIQGGNAGLDVNSSLPVAVSLRSCTIASNAVNGIAVNTTSNQPVRLTVTDSSIALNGTGIRLVQTSSLVLGGSMISASAGSGLVVGAGCDVHVDSSTLTLNGLAAVDNSGTTTLSASEVTYNSRAFRGSALVQTHGNNAIVENNGTGIGLPKPPVLVKLQ